MILSMAPLALSLESDGDQPSLVVSGHVDETNVDRLVTVLDHLVEENERCVSLDLADVTSIDETALSCLAESADTFSKRQKRLRIKDASNAVQQTLDRHIMMDLFCCERKCTGHACELTAQFCRTEVFTLPNEPANCSEARRRVRQVAESVGLGGNWLRDVIVAVGEAVANAIKHGGIGSKDDSFTVSCIASPKQISISVSDSGSGFSPKELPTFEDALFRESGRGVYCMNALMDEVSFNFESGTSVRLVKYMA